MGSIIELKSVKKTYKAKNGPTVRALRGVDLSIDEGEYVAIQGPSGSGKSTLLAIMGLLETPDTGEVLFHGEDTSALSANDLADLRSRSIGFVFQAFHLLPRLTAAANVELPMIYAGMKRSDRKKRVKSLLKDLGLARRGDHRPNELSGGERQRVAIGRALANSPWLLLADEPTGNLDQKTGKEILDLLEALNRDGTTLVMVTHEPSLAKRADRAVNVLDGELT